MEQDQAPSAAARGSELTEGLGPLPEAALTVVHNPHTMERQVSTHGVAYYGSNWYAERECYTADQVRAYAAEQVAAARERWQSALDAAVAAERERCAALCKGDTNGIPFDVHDSRLRH